MTSLQQRPNADLGNAAPDRPRELTADDFALMTGTSAAAAVAESPAPTMQPPANGGRLLSAGTINGQKITALWSNSADRNSYIYLETAKWKKLGNATDNGVRNLTQLAGSARLSKTAPDLVEDANGLITAMYVW